MSIFIFPKSCCLYTHFPQLYPVDGSAIGMRWCGQSSLNSKSNSHIDGAAIAPLCKLVKRGAVRANDLPWSNDLKAWPDSSLGRTHDTQSQGLRVRIPLRSVIFSYFRFSVTEVLYGAQMVILERSSYQNVIGYI